MSTGYGCALRLSITSVPKRWYLGVPAASVNSRFKAGEGKVEVTWAFDQDANFGSKVMAVFMDMDKMLGPDFEKGLANLKGLVEADTAKDGGES